MKRAALVAVDLGAESCRVSLLRWIGGSPEIRVVHRFSNAPLRRENALRWDIERIVQGVMEGLCVCAAIADEGIDAIGVDGWAVDYVRIGPDGRVLGNPFCYRDERTVTAEKQVQELISPEKLYGLTGIQFLRFNTIYQLYADRQNGIDPSAPWINIPEYVTYRLGGRRVAEYTNATHTQLVGLDSRDWCAEIFDRSGLDRTAAPPIVDPGSIVGRLTGPLAELPALSNTRLIVPACHDTASAIAGIPAEGDDWAFISSGTWSLVGTTLDRPRAGSEAFRKNFTNLGGAGGKICFLKNVNGMWLLQQCLESWKEEGCNSTIPEMIHRCARLAPPDSLLDVDDPDLLLPGNMPAKFNAQFARRKVKPLPSNDSARIEIANLILHSLAARYAEVLDDVRAITGKAIRKLYIVGGGSKNTLLNRLTGERTGLHIITGAVESSTIGNFAVQLATLDAASRVPSGSSSSAITAWARVLASSLRAESEAAAPLLA